MEINTITVIGSGVMGSGIAALLANAGFPAIYLIDVLPSKLTDSQIKAGYSPADKNIRNLVARKNLNALISGKPPQLGSLGLLQSITLGNTEDNFEEYVSSADWIIEVVPEVAKIKNDTFLRIDKARKSDSIVSSNTSGISIEEMIRGCSESLARHFLVTHFFNPPRYMRLLEIVIAEKTSGDVVSTIEEIGRERLGKGIVRSYDVPGFVGNRIGVFNLMFLMSLVGEYSIEEINTVFDKKLGYGGKPFSTCDLVGLDVLFHVIKNIADNTKDEMNHVFAIPDFLKRLIDSGNLGRKTGAGFFKREKHNGRNTDYVVNPETLEYEPEREVGFPSLRKAKAASSEAEAIRILYNASDRGGKIYSRSINALIKYSFARIPRISPDGIRGIDLAIKWGFNQAFGPGEILDIIGVEKVIDAICKEGEIPPGLSELYKSGKKRVYFTDENKKERVFTGKNEHSEIVWPKKHLSFAWLSKTKAAVFEIKNGGRLFEAEDGIFAVEILSRNGMINQELIDAVLKALRYAEEKGRGLVIGNDLENFSFGADLDMFAGFLLRKKTERVRSVILDFQLLNHALKFSKIPVVTMKRGIAIGGGCELGYGTHIRAAFDTYTGLVEFGVGFIPAGGGIKETLVNKFKKHAGKTGSKPSGYIKETFLQIAFARVSKSALEAKELGYMGEDDGITMNPDFLLYDAIEDIKRLSSDYRPKEETRVLLPGADMKATLFAGIDLAIAAGQLPPQKVPRFIRRHFELTAKTLANVVSGGELLPPGKETSELDLLARERDGFLRLSSEMSLKERLAWIAIASSVLKKKPVTWAIRSVLSSFSR